MLAGSDGFPTLEEEIYGMPMLRVLGQMRYLLDKSRMEMAEHERRERERELAARRAKMLSSQKGSRHGGGSGNLL